MCRRPFILWLVCERFFSLYFSLFVLCCAELRYATLTLCVQVDFFDWFSSFPGIFCIFSEENENIYLAWFDRFDFDFAPSVVYRFSVANCNWDFSHTYMEVRVVIHMYAWLQAQPFLSIGVRVCCTLSQVIRLFSRCCLFSLTTLCNAFFDVFSSLSFA